ncbi:hypothetical protein GTW25_00560 [Aliihoeflea aestuarii]|uniref:hypothetical protein n=1 Tax=Aliihoeflea aestuarii TaxID=453840 RepID=UPI0020934E0A|nr:hypothetical protein [Aliihoeflea aestuarii]MCO6389521.1 hypothetical protein [Aliihoeflea aestuarii]
MSSVEFRQFASSSQSTKSDRLLRAAVSAFCSIQRPSRQEIAQIEDLAEPLLADVSRQTLRFVAAALSECLHPPAVLVRRLCAEPVDICAPLLVRSNALRDIDLLSLIGRHGLGHALAIERRRELDPRIARLIETLKTSPKADETEATSSPPAMLDRLRAMMVKSPERDMTARWPEAPSAYLKLRAAALTGNPSLVRRTLASLAGIDEHDAAGLIADTDQSRLTQALKGLSLSVEQAYLVVSASQPYRFGTAASIRAFIEDYGDASSSATPAAPIPLRRSSN